ncbi:MAG: methyltransferase domain-containing protein [Pseudanabaenaceae cyanobacterium]
MVRYYLVSAGACMLESGIARMYKYRLPRLWGELSAITKPVLTVPDLVPFDHYHYCGTEAIDVAVQRTGWQSGAHLLDIGAGIGGTARYLAWRYGLRVTGIELQPQLYEAGKFLTDRTGLAGQVHLYQGDFLVESPLHSQKFDGWIALMVFLHIPDRQTLFQRCAQVLKAGGRFYIEDYFQQQPLTKAEQSTLAHEIACPYLPTQAEYIAQLEQAGFRDIHFENVTPLWRWWVANRYQRFQEQQAIYLQRHGTEMVNSYLQFYGAVADLFAGGKLGGARIWGTI